MSHAFHIPQAHGQDWLGAIQGLNLRLFINAKNHGLIRWMQVESDNIAHLFDEELIGREFEMALPVRLESERVPNAMHRGRREAGMLRDGAYCPMRTIFRFCG